MTRVLLLVMCAGFVACAAPDSGGQADAIMEADRAFARATAERGVDGWVSFFADDGAMVGQTQVVGHDSIRAAMAPAFADSTFSLEWEPVQADVAESGDLGYTLGRYESRRVGPDGQPVRQTGSYLTVWKRGADGSWKVALDIGSPDTSP